MRYFMFQFFAHEAFDLSVEEPLTSDDTVGVIDEILEKTESSVCKELELSLIVSIIRLYYCFLWSNMVSLELESMKTDLSFPLIDLFKIETLSSSNPSCSLKTMQTLILPQSNIFIY